MMKMVGDNDEMTMTMMKRWWRWWWWWWWWRRRRRWGGGGGGGGGGGDAAAAAVDDDDEKVTGEDEGCRGKMDCARQRGEGEGDGNSGKYRESFQYDSEIPQFKSSSVYEYYESEWDKDLGAFKSIVSPYVLNCLPAWMPACLFLCLSVCLSLSLSLPPPPSLSLD